MGQVDQARNELKEILSQREYQIYYEDHRNFLQIAWDYLKDWILKLLSKWFSSLHPSNGLATGILIGITAIVLVFIALAVFLGVRAMRRKQKFHELKPLETMGGKQWSAETHLAEAKRQESEGNYSLATRHLFLALLLHFHELGWLEARSWKTNWEYYDELRKVNSDGAGQFFHLAQLFDEVFYGERRMNKEDYLAYRNETMKWFEEDRTETTVQG